MVLCQGAPVRNEIEALGLDRLAEATDAAAKTFVQRLEPGTVNDKTHVFVSMMSLTLRSLHLAENATGSCAIRSTLSL